MGLSIFLAKLIGIYLLIIAIIWVVHKDHFEASLRDFLASRGLILFSGLSNIVLGLAIAIGHPIWQFSWIGLITLLGYLMIVRGVAWVAFGEKIREHALMLLSRGHWIMVAVLLVLGAFLTYHGFAAV